MPRYSIQDEMLRFIVFEMLVIGIKDDERLYVEESQLANTKPPRATPNKEALGPLGQRATLKTC